MILTTAIRQFEFIVVLALLLFPVHAGFAQETPDLKEYKDDQYAFRFVYPADWQLEALPEGDRNPSMRVRLRGPAGSSFVVVVEDTGRPLSKMEFERDGKSQKRVQAMMRQTLEQTYRAISKNIGARSMKTGEAFDLSNEHGVKFYLATLHEMKSGAPVIVAGTHVYPFSKDYSVNFLMTAFHRGISEENRMLTAVFNSFRMQTDGDAAPK
jgi:hypothetical protein